MAKKKVNRPRKKHKYTRRQNNGDNFNLKSNEQDLNENEQSAKAYKATFTFDEVTGQTQPASAEQKRASENTYVFINGCKVQVRSLSDEVLNNHYERIRVAAFEARRNTTLLEKIGHDMDKEQRFRGLK